jgi:hypothetical protein
MATVTEFVVAADAERWRSVGFAVNDAGLMQLGGIRVRFVDPANASVGIQSWVIADAADQSVTSIDGLNTAHGEAYAEVAATALHPNGMIGIDHVVVYTPHLELTCDAIAGATGAPLKRIREVGALRQGFHRLGELIVEVVTYPDIGVDAATFWGLALNVADIDHMYATYGDGVMSAPKDAVQPGRQISSFRNETQLGLPVAMMTASSRR